MCEYSSVCAQYYWSQEYTHDILYMYLMSGTICVHTATNCNHELQLINDA